MTFFPRPEQQKKKKMFENKTPHYSFIIKKPLFKGCGKNFIFTCLTDIKKTNQRKKNKIPGGIN